MDDRTGMAKCFTIITENCKEMLVDFVEDRECTPNRTLMQYILGNTDIVNDPMVSRALKNVQSSSELDISALVAVIGKGKILKTHEEKSTAHAMNTIGDLIDRIRICRNDIAHPSKGSLDKKDYNKNINEYKDIAKKFEIVNRKLPGTYTGKIEKIDSTPWADAVVEQTIVRYREYVETIIKFEIIPGAELLTGVKMTNVLPESDGQGQQCPHRCDSLLCRVFHLNHHHCHPPPDPEERCIVM